MRNKNSLLAILLLTIGLAINLAASSCSRINDEFVQHADSLWWNFSTPSLKMDDIKGHLDSAVYKIYESSENGMKSSFLGEWRNTFDSLGQWTNTDQLLILPSIGIINGTKIFKNDKISNCCINWTYFKYGDILWHNTDYYYKVDFNYNNDDWLNSITGDYTAGNYVQKSNISFLRDNNGHIEYATISLKYYHNYRKNVYYDRWSRTQYYENKTEFLSKHSLEAVYTYEYLEFDEHGNWTKCVRHNGNKHILICRTLYMKQPDQAYYERLYEEEQLEKKAKPVLNHLNSILAKIYNDTFENAISQSLFSASFTKAIIGSEGAKDGEMEIDWFTTPPEDGRLTAKAIKATEIDKDRATIKVEVKVTYDYIENDDNPARYFDIFKMIKENGKWKVDDVIFQEKYPQKKAMLECL